MIGIHYLLRSLYCKQKVDESQQSSSSQLELNNILSAHDCKYAFSGETFATHDTKPQLHKVIRNGKEIGCPYNIPPQLAIIVVDCLPLQDTARLRYWVYATVSNNGITWPYCGLSI